MDKSLSFGEKGNEEQQCPPSTSIHSRLYMRGKQTPGSPCQKCNMPSQPELQLLSPRTGQDLGFFFFFSYGEGINQLDNISQTPVEELRLQDQRENVPIVQRAPCSHRPPQGPKPQARIQCPSWTPTQAGGCVIEKEHWTWGIHHFYSEQKQACSLGKDLTLSPKAAHGTHIMKKSCSDVWVRSEKYMAVIVKHLR